MTTFRPSRQSRLLGKSDLSVSPMAWGRWRLAGDDVAAVRALIDAALGAGITLFDTAARLPTEQGSRYGVDRAVAALAWAMAHPARIIPIIGSQNVERIAAAAGAYKVEWTRAQWYAVLEAGVGEKLP